MLLGQEQNLSVKRQRYRLLDMTGCFVDLCRPPQRLLRPLVMLDGRTRQR